MKEIDGYTTRSEAQIVPASEELTQPEQIELANLEAQVQRGIKAFWEMGEALRQIRDKRLYRQNYSSFEKYCPARWQISWRSAYQLIEAAVLMENLRHGAGIETLPANERQARPLTALPAEKQRQAWVKAVTTAPSGRITYHHVVKIAKEYHEPRQLANGSKKGRKTSTHEQDREVLPENLLQNNTTPAKNSTEEQESESIQQACCLTLQIPFSLQAAILETAKASGISAEEWAVKILQSVIKVNS